jgi:LemA protein
MQPSGNTDTAPRPFLSRAAINTLVGLLIVFVLGLWLVGNYNSLVQARNDTTKSWSKVETQYQRRFDLVGNLVESVKGAQGQEAKVFGDIAAARTGYANASNPSDKAKAASAMETNIALIPRLQEAYPELKSNALVASLMTQLTGTEDGILGVRNTYNDTATNYNTNIESFPKSVFASVFGFKEFALFKADTAAAKAPAVKF